MLLLGRGFAVALATLTNFGDGLLLTENGRPLAAQDGPLIALDDDSADLPILLSEAGDVLIAEAGTALVAEVPPPLALESGDTLVAESGDTLTLE